MSTVVAFRPRQANPAPSPEDQRAWAILARAMWYAALESSEARPFGNGWRPMPTTCVRSGGPLRGPRRNTRRCSGECWLERLVHCLALAA
jgi:hypothetical protein